MDQCLGNILAQVMPLLETCVVPCKQVGALGRLDVLELSHGYSISHSLGKVDVWGSLMSSLPCHEMYPYSSLRCRKDMIEGWESLKDL